ncbi:hypothetical protein VKS41_004676 [Umbelopsis sp. WA50703]
MPATQYKDIAGRSGIRDKCAFKRKAFKSPVIQKKDIHPKALTESMDHKIQSLEENVRMLKQAYMIREKDEYGKLENLVAKWKHVAQHVALDVIGTISVDSQGLENNANMMLNLLNTLNIPYELVGCDNTEPD